MKKDDIIMTKMTSAAALVPPTDYTSQLASMLTVLYGELREEVAAQLVKPTTGQIYARTNQFAERWGCSENTARRYLYAAEHSGRVNVIQPTDVNGVKGLKMYCIRDVERFFDANPTVKK